MACVILVHGQFAENNNAETFRAWKLRWNVHKPRVFD